MEQKKTVTVSEEDLIKIVDASIKQILKLEKIEGHQFDIVYSKDNEK